MSALTPDEIKSCKTFFSHFTKSQQLNEWQLLCALETMGYAPTSESLKLISQHTQIESADFASFLKAIVIQRDYERRLTSDNDYLGAFIALGGNRDGSGSIPIEKLRKVIKEEFGLGIKLEEMVEELGATAEEGRLELKEFKVLFS